MTLQQLGEMLVEQQKCPHHTDRCLYERRSCHQHDYCSGHLVLRVGNERKLFWGCSNYPECTASQSFSWMVNLRAGLRYAVKKLLKEGKWRG